VSVELHESVTATELVRNLSGLIDKVRISQRSLYITKGAQTVAELSPPPRPGMSVGDLTHFLASLPSLGDEASSMSDDIAVIREKSRLPESPWD
jgi:antitoxin (DNA-binding transcriptional repressor) of toxin-antitoxin stability system